MIILHTQLQLQIPELKITLKILFESNIYFQIINLLNLLYGGNFSYFPLMMCE